MQERNVFLALFATKMLLNDTPPQPDFDWSPERKEFTPEEFKWARDSIDALPDYHVQAFIANKDSANFDECQDEMIDVKFAGMDYIFCFHEDDGVLSICVES